MFKVIAKFLFAAVFTLTTFVGLHAKADGSKTDLGDQYYDLEFDTTYSFVGSGTDFKYEGKCTAKLSISISETEIYVRTDGEILCTEMGGENDAPVDSSDYFAVERLFTRDPQNKNKLYISRVDAQDPDKSTLVEVGTFQDGKLEVKWQESYKDEDFSSIMSNAITVDLSTKPGVFSTLFTAEDTEGQTVSTVTIKANGTANPAEVSEESALP